MALNTLHKWTRRERINSNRTAGKCYVIWDNDVLLNTEAVVEAIWNVVGDRTLTPTPLPEGEGFQSKDR